MDPTDCNGLRCFLFSPTFPRGVDEHHISSLPDEHGVDQISPLSRHGGLPSRQLGDDVRWAFGSLGKLGRNEEF